jgi:hypothetical protein
MEAVPIIIIIGAPILASMGCTFAFVENILVRILMVAVLIYAIRFSGNPMLALLVLLAIVTLILERNHVVVAGLPDQKIKGTIIGPANLYPMKAPDTVTHVTVEDSYNDLQQSQEEYNDERIEISEGPSNKDSPDFYKARGLV